MQPKRIDQIRVQKDGSAGLNGCSLDRRVFALCFDVRMRVGINYWRNAVIKFARMGLSAVAATAALSLAVATAEAQTTAPAPAAPPAGAPAAKAPAAPAKAPAAPAKTETKAPAKTEAPKAAAKAASQCKGLVEAACGANADCQWIVPQKANAKTGKVAQAYCKSKPKPKGAAKSAGAAAPAAKAPAAPATPAAPAKSEPTKK